MTALLIQGFMDTYRNLGGALRLFWPVLAAFLVWYAVAFAIGYSATQSEAMPITDPTLFVSFLISGLCVVFYAFFMLCQGAVGWHRRILLGESPGWVSPLPRRRAFQYALAVFLFGLVVLIAHIPVLFFLLPWMQSAMAPIVWDANAGNPTPDQLEAMWNSLKMVQVVGFIIGIAVMSAILWLLRSWLLAFPHISIRTVQPLFGQIRESLTTPIGLVGALVIVYFLPSLLSLLYGLVIPVTTQLLPLLAVPMSILSLVISAFCFLWGLSILSLTYAEAAPDQLHYDGRSNQA